MKAIEGLNKFYGVERMVLRGEEVITYKHSAFTFLNPRQYQGPQGYHFFWKLRKNLGAVKENTVNLVFLWIYGSLIKYTYKL